MTLALVARGKNIKSVASSALVGASSPPPLFLAGIKRQKRHRFQRISSANSPRPNPKSQSRKSLKKSCQLKSLKKRLPSTLPKQTNQWRCCSQKGEFDIKFDHLAGVAQLVEHPTCNRTVEGSIPFSSISFGGVA